MFTRRLVLAAFVSPILLAPVVAQQSGFTRTPLKTLDFPAGYTTVSAITEIAPNSSLGRHTHPGVDTGYVLEGELVLLVDGKPEQRLKAGHSYQNPAGVPHDARNIGDKPVRLFTVLTIEKGKPLTSPAQ
jgi:quercetin dioxygenase-like cupin family protein